MGLKTETFYIFAAMSSEIHFPQYRRLINGKNYYRIDAPLHMTEIQVMGPYWMKRTLEARILPERLLVEDILKFANGHLENITAAEYDAFEEHCKNNLQLRDV